MLLWNTLPQRWSVGHVTFVVGQDVGDHEQQTFNVNRDLICELSPVVTAAISGDFREAKLKEILLPQFVPKDFELFLRLVQVGAFAHPPQIQAPVINDELVLSVLPIAAYLEVKQVLKWLEAHVQTTPSIATLLAFEKCALDDVVWLDPAYACLLEHTTRLVHVRYLEVKDGTIQKKLSHDSPPAWFHPTITIQCARCKGLCSLGPCTSCRASEGGTIEFPNSKSVSVKAYGVIPTNGDGVGTESILDLCSAKTSRGFVKYLLTHQKCLQIP